MITEEYTMRGFGQRTLSTSTEKALPYPDHFRCQGKEYCSLHKVQLAATATAAGAGRTGAV